jgi:hypothetical protein
MATSEKSQLGNNISLKCKRTLMLRGSLYAGLRWVWEHATCNSQTDLCTNDARVRIVTCASSILDEKSKGYHEKDRACYNERLETTDFEHDGTENEAHNDGRKAVKRGDARGAFDGLVKCNNQYSVKEVALHRPRYIVYQLRQHHKIWVDLPKFSVHAMPSAPQTARSFNS